MLVTKDQGDGKPKDYPTIDGKTYINGVPLPPRLQALWDKADEIDAAVARNLADPNYVPETFPQVRDPFGMNWDWVENALPKDGTAPVDPDQQLKLPPAEEPGTSSGS